MKKWSEESWIPTEDIFNRTIAHPFVRGIADGTLPKEKFHFYLGQDALYLRQYFRVLSHLAARLKDSRAAADFIGFARDGIAVEKTLHESYLDKLENRCATMSPTCTMYTSVLLSATLEDAAVEAAAVLPCFRIYQQVGRHILRQRKDTRRNPYSAWIDTYADPAFERSTLRATEICDTLAEEASPSVRKAMTDIFVLCARMEWMFWDSAWNLEQWKI